MDEKSIFPTGRILITGDTHGDTGALRMLMKQIGSGDILLIAGDFGYVFYDTPEERSFLTDTDLLLKKKNAYILFVDGNHENHHLLQQYPVEHFCNAKVHRIRPHIIHILRGEILELKGKKFFCFGGAFSIDRAYRRLNESFWLEELPTDDDLKNGNQNLERCGYQVDYIVTHTCPLELIPYLGGYHAAQEEAPLQNYFQWISERVAFTHWYFGHWHQDRVIRDRYRALYLDMEDIETQKKVW